MANGQHELNKMGAQLSFMPLVHQLRKSWHALFLSNHFWSITSALLTLDLELDYPV